MRNDNIDGDESLYIIHVMQLLSSYTSTSFTKTKDRVFLQLPTIKICWMCCISISDYYNTYVLSLRNSSYFSYSHVIYGS